MRALRSLLLVAVVATGLVAAPASPVSAAPNDYVTVSDGTRIAVNIRMPQNYVPGARYPVLFEMSGYDGGSAQDGTLSKDIADQTGLTFLPLQGDSRQLSRTFEDAYVTVHASVRGTGCSSGEFDLFSWRSALDGYELIEWAAGQSWANGDVALMGHSYGGITGFMIAATRPPSLRAMTVSGLIDDLYRGIVYPGGVSNYGFPLLWTGGVRNAYDILGGTAPGLVRDDRENATRADCAGNLATHSRTVLNDPIVQGATDTDNAWWHVRALATYAHLIDVPIHITGAYQDEQTGPRGPARLWEMIQGVPKKLILTNGDHGTAGPYRGEVLRERRAWIDHWMGLVQTASFGTFAEERTGVTVLWEMSGGQHNGRLDSAGFPLPETQWTDLHFSSDGRLTTAAEATDGKRSYVSGSPRQGWSYQAGPTFGSQVTTPEGPDELTYVSEPVGEQPLAIAGPITATLHMTSTAPDTEVFVQLIDLGPDGSRTYLQRGMLKASHRAIDEAHSAKRPDGTIYRPHRPHTNPTLITPGQAYEYLVEVFPVGHVFRPGHKIMVKIHTPPAVDSYYAYVPKRPVGLNALLHYDERPSRITLPVVPLQGPLGEERACGDLEAVRCVK